MKLLASIIIITMLIAMASSIVNAGSINIAIYDDKAHISIELSANITKLPINSYRLYRDFHFHWKHFWKGILNTTRGFIERYLRDKLGLRRASVENLNITFRIEEDYSSFNKTPNSVNIINGSLVNGSIHNLSSVDGVYMVFKAVNIGNELRIELDILVSLPKHIVLDKVSNTTLYLSAKLNRYIDREASVYIYDHHDKTFRKLGSINSTSLENLSIPIDRTYIENYLLLIKILVVDTNTTSDLYLYIDRLVLSFKHLIVSIRISIDLDISGIANRTIGGLVIDTRFRYLTPDQELEYSGIRFNPVQVFLWNLSCFNVSLDTWNRTFNGTHTIFSYQANATVMALGGYIVTIDPQEAIVVEGEASASGDYIYVKTPFFETVIEKHSLWIIALIAILAITALILAIKKGIKHIVLELYRPRFVRKRV